MDHTPEELAALGMAGVERDSERLDKVDKYVRGEHAEPYTPQNASAEYKLLAQRAVSNWMPLLVKTPAQALTVSGYRRSAADVETPPEWRAWQDNRLDSRQAAVHRSALTYGVAYATVLPHASDASRPVVRGVSPRLMYASYEDPSSDATPLWALQLDTVPDSSSEDAVKAWLYDDLSVYEMEIEGSGDDASATLLSSYQHGVRLNGEPVCPVVRFAPDVDLEGRVTGVIEPMIPLQDRVNQTVFDLLVAQTFGSFKVRTVSGMAPEFRRDPDTGEIMYDENGRPIPIAIRADASRFMMAPEADTKFGTLDETPLGGFLEAIEAGVKHIAAISQTPPHYLLGSVVNLSAEALAGAESALNRAVSEYQNVLGESWELVLALCSEMLGREYDPEAQVTWMDHESRSLSQTVDALGKAVQMLQVPARAMWSRIPGATEKDAEDWAAMAEADDPTTRMADSMARALMPDRGGNADETATA